VVEHEILTEKGSDALPAPGRRRKVLVVDGNVAAQDVMPRLLSSLGYDGTIAGNGPDAGVLFVTGAYDLVITDLEMPLVNGWELSRIVKERSPKTPLVVVTGVNGENHWEKMNMSCIDAIVMKPFKSEEIARTIQRLLNNGV
jgi:CheY-like chemotaxis protein